MFLTIIMNNTFFKIGDGSKSLRVAERGLDVREQAMSINGRVRRVSLAKPSRLIQIFMCRQEKEWNKAT